MNKKVCINYLPFDKERDPTLHAWEAKGTWKASWISIGDEKPPFIAAYRCFFNLENSSKIRMHITADERYEMYLDGDFVGRGSEAGDGANWYFDTYDLNIDKGEHLLVVRSWNFGGVRPWFQTHIRHGIIVSPEKEEYMPLFATGIANWEGLLFEGCSFVGVSSLGIGTGARLSVDGNTYPWGFEKGKGDGWRTAIVNEDGINRKGWYFIGQDNHLLKPAPLPPMLTGVIREYRKTIPSNTKVCEIIDLDDYYTAYNIITASGGKDARISVKWAESLFDENGLKGNRNETENKRFLGIGDEITTDGMNGRTFRSILKSSGRYVEICIETKQQPLEINIMFDKTRYPLQCESSFSTEKGWLDQLIPICLRSLYQCCHDTYMDCPYYEQLMYIGDTRLQILCSYVISGDIRPALKAIDIMAASMSNSDLDLNSAYPSNGGKYIPSFSLWWIAMLYDVALWRGEKEFITSFMPQARFILDKYTKNDGLNSTPNGWNFFESADDCFWSDGIPPGEPSALFNLQLALTWDYMAKLEEYAGEQCLAERARGKANQIKKAVKETFWNQKKGMFADDPEFTCFSQATQVLAAMCGFDMKDALQKDVYDVRCNISFSHYLFEIYLRQGMTDKFIYRMEDWHKLISDGFKTTPEIFGDTRSDCHAWSAHPIYHFYTGILGIRPTTFGFEQVEIMPQIDQCGKVSGNMVHPKGFINLEADTNGATIGLPNGVTGRCVYKGETWQLKEGINQIKWDYNGASLI